MNAYEYNENLCLDIRIFAEKVCREVSAGLGEDYQVKLQEVTKNNGVILQGLVILGKERNVSPTIYLNSFLEAYEHGVPLDDIVQRILEIYEQDAPGKNVDMSFFREFEKVKDRICFRLVNREKNRALLDRIPHVDFLDLTICFYYSYVDEEMGSGSILIYNNHLEMWGCTVEELMKLARRNTPGLYPWEVRSMEEVLQELLKEEEECEDADFPELPPEEPLMQVLSNERRVHGAACILYPKVLDILGEKIGGDFYILPCSVHEVILLSRENAQEESVMREMVREINATQVEPEEVLSDNLYIYHVHESRMEVL